MSPNALISQVRARTKAIRTELPSSVAGEHMGYRKLSFYLRFPFYFVNEVRKDVATGLIGGLFLSKIVHAIACFFLIKSGADFLVLEAYLGILAVCFCRDNKRYLDSTDIPLLRYFATLPWSNRKLVMHYCVGSIARCSPLLASWLVGGVFLHFQKLEGEYPSLAASMFVSLVCNLFIIVWANSLSTVKFHVTPFGFWFAMAVLSACGFLLLTFSSTVFPHGIINSLFVIPVAWPYCILEVKMQGASFYVLSAAWLAAGSFHIALAGLSISRLYRQLPIIEFFQDSSPGCFAITESERTGFLAYQRWADESADQLNVAGAASSLDEHSTRLEVPFESISESLADGFAFSEHYWLRQGWLRPLAMRWMNRRELMLVAFNESIHGNQDFPKRIKQHLWQCLSCLCLILLSIAFVTQPVIGKLLVFLTGTVISLTVLYSVKARHQPLHEVRRLPFSALEIVISYAKLIFLEGGILWSLLALLLAAHSTICGFGFSDTARIVWIGTILYFCTSIWSVAIALFNGHRKSVFVHRSDWGVVFGLLLFFIACACLFGMFLGGIPLVILSSVLLLCCALGITKLMIWTYNHGPVDII